MNFVLVAVFFIPTLSLAQPGSAGGSIEGQDRRAKADMLQMNHAAMRGLGELTYRMAMEDQVKVPSDAKIQTVTKGPFSLQKKITVGKSLPYEIKVVNQAKKLIPGPKFSAAQKMCLSEIEKSLQSIDAVKYAKDHKVAVIQVHLTDLTDANEQVDLAASYSLAHRVKVATFKKEYADPKGYSHGRADLPKKFPKEWKIVKHGYEKAETTYMSEGQDGSVTPVPGTTTLPVYHFKIETLKKVPDIYRVIAYLDAQGKCIYPQFEKKLEIPSNLNPELDSLILDSFKKD
jgi:hypothetical protein